MTAESMAFPPMIMIIRHAEKPHTGKPHGVTSDGNHDHASLTVAGWVRAGAMTELLASAWRDPPEGLRRPDRIYAAGYHDGQAKRSIETVQPLAARIGIDIDARYYEGDETDLAKEIRELDGTTLVSWHHESIHHIVKHLGHVQPKAPRRWPDDRYDLFWTFTRLGDGWRFDQVPHLFTRDDRADPITDAHAAAEEPGTAADTGTDRENDHADEAQRDTA